MSLDEILQTKWHAISAREAANILETDLQKGLSAQTAARRGEFFGLNKLPEEKPPSKLLILLKQFKSPLIFILVAAGLVTLFFREFSDSLVIFGAVFINTIIGYTQENRAKDALPNLKQILEEQATVIRGGQEMETTQEDLVPGDLLVLHPGDKVPADARIFECWNLHIAEATLTGEWLGSSKENIVLDQKTPLADRDNMLYMGSVVEEGTGKAMVCSTGIHTELGKISALITRVKEEQTPYQKKLTRFSWMIGSLICALAFLIFVEGILTGKEIFEMFKKEEAD